MTYSAILVQGLVELERKNFRITAACKSKEKRAATSKNGGYNASISVTTPGGVITFGGELYAPPKTGVRSIL